ncbi:hypothetical protein ['Fragaria x ananassa' phyllody phytoplasma]
MLEAEQILLAIFFHFFIFLFLMVIAISANWIISKSLGPSPMQIN